MHKLLITAAAALATIAAGAPALAQQVPTRTVTSAGLDLSTAQGRRALDRRVAGAIEAVCGSYANRDADQVKACRKQAQATMVRRDGRTNVAAR